MTRLRRCAWPVVWLFACATSGGVPAPARPGARYVAKGPPASAYRTEPAEGEALRGPHALRVARGIARASQQRSQPLTPDARLAELAMWISGALDARGSPPPYEVIDFWTHYLGLPEPTPHLLVLSQSDATTLEDRVASEVAALMPELRYTHYGAATLEQNGMVVAVLVFSWRWLTLAPVPRAVELGATLDLEGRLLGDVSAAQLVVSYPDGTSSRSEAGSGTGIAQHVVTRGAGEHRIELLASSARGDTVVANFPVYVGVPPPSEITLQAEPSGAELDAAQSRQRLLELINDARKRVGIAPLVADERLAGIALAHSQDMQQHGFVGHTSPTTGNAEDRARRAGIRTPLVLENIGRGYSPDEVHRGLMESPGHRENVLNPQATHVGIGVVLAPEDQRTAYLATELFARFATAIDIGAAPELWLDAVNRARARRGSRPLVHDKAMAQLCQRAAADFFGAPGKSRQGVVEDLNRKAAGAHPVYARLGALLTLVSSLDEGTQLDALLDPKARAVGLGVAQGTRTDTIENAIALVALVGY